MALDDMKKALEPDVDEAPTEKSEGDSVGLEKAAKAVQRNLTGDPGKLARALKAFIQMCEEDY